MRLGFRIELKPARRRRSSSSSAFVALSRLEGFETRRRSRLFWLGMGEEGFGAPPLRVPPERPVGSRVTSQDDEFALGALGHGEVEA